MAYPMIPVVPSGDSKSSYDMSMYFGTAET